MTVRQALKYPDLPRREGRAILKALLNCSDSALFLREDQTLDPEDEALFLELCRARAAGRPLAYVLGFETFYGRTFMVNEDVLIPRPESEALVTLALRERPATVLDLCTGSGILAISIQKESSARVTASDISAQALVMARRNADRLRAEVDFVQSDLFAEIEGCFDVIVSNPPYIDDTVLEGLDVSRHEPRLALSAGHRGLDYYKKIIPEAKAHLCEGGVLLLEIGYDQGEAIRDLLVSHGYEEICIEKDLAGFERIARAVRR